VLRRSLALATLLLLGSVPAHAQDRGAPPPDGPRRGGPPRLEPTAPLPAAAEKIAWYGTWQEGLAEARRSGRPILLVAAAPQCHEVPGMW